MMITSFPFWFNFIYFWIAVFIAFYIPGEVILKKYNLGFFQNVVLGTVIGMVLWGWQGFVFGYLGFRFLSYVYLLVFLCIWIKIHLKDLVKIKELKFSIKKKNLDIILILLFIFGILSQLTSVWLVGIMTQKGLYFCCGNTLDNILQLAITNQMLKGFPPLEPGMYPVIIQNYHYWDSLIMGELIRVFKLPLLATDYQYMTVFISLFFGLAALSFSKIIKLKQVFSRWLIFFLYFGGDLIWLLVLFTRKKDLFAMSPMESGQQFLENIPRAMAMIVFFCALSLLTLWIKNKKIALGIIVAAVLASLVGLKIYIGIFAFAGLGILLIYFFIKRKFIYLFPILSAFLLAAIVYFPVNAHAGGLFFTGLWKFENFIVQPYFGSLPRMELARLIYLTHHNWLRVFGYEAIFATLFIVTTFGTKLLGLIQSKKSLSLLPIEIHIFLFAGIITSAVLGLFFQQSTGGANTFNFLAAIFIIGSIYSALFCLRFFGKQNKFIKISLILVIVLLTSMRSFNQVYRNISNVYEDKGFLVTNRELQAINFLSRQEQGFVVVDPKIAVDKESPYLSLLSNKNMFLSGRGTDLETHGVNFSERLKTVNTVFYGVYPASVSAALLANNISYIYMLNIDILPSTDSAKFLRIAYENLDIKILTVDRNLAKQYLKNHKK